MNKKLVLVLTTVPFFLILSASTLVAENVISAGARYHCDHSVFEELPFGDGDISYWLAYECHEESGYWQIGVDYAPDVSGIESTDYVITPQINLVLKDNMWRGGVGALNSYIHDEASGGNWSDLYWQLLVGVGLPMFGIQLDLHVYYVFEEWKQLDEFDWDDLEFGAGLKFSF